MELRRAGTPVATNDLWIAASACAVGATLLTHDRTFLQIRHLGVHLLEA